MKLRLKHIAIALVILWMGTIFCLSAQPAPKSSELSSGLTITVLNILPQTKNLSETKKTEIAFSVSYWVRKAAHLSIYLILALLVALLFSCYTMKTKKRILLTLAVCLLYSLTDELHQLYVPGRSCEFADVMIDFSGILVGTILFFFAILRIPKIKGFIEAG